MQNIVNQVAKIKVIGVGGGGNNAVNRMFVEKVQGVEFYVANTDAQVLQSSPIPNKILLGEQTTKGLGAGGNPEIGKQAALESESLIKEALQDADLVFIAAGMGGGTGTGAAPIVARIAQELGALVVAVVTKPFQFEGKNRINNAKLGLEEIKKHIDSIIVISNNKLLENIGSIPIADSFRQTDAILKQGVQTITDLIAVPAMINLDFADIKNVMSKKGDALFGIGIASGKDKATQAAKKAMSSSLLDASIAGAKDVIVNITGGANVSLDDAYDAVDVINQEANNKDLNIIFGMAVNDELTSDDEIIVTVIATGFSVDQQQQNKEQNPTSNYRSTNLEAIIKNKDQQLDDDEFDEQTISFTVDDDDDEDFPTFLK
ncbi:cell division protein FtsZ [Mycoplasma putrefaciens]|uniref:Cell division protein FtsZ n=1 Tax=Mycoplasma putrefaciens (strain ATCC 15718 / NCTC 10155 / C30 KS-1 / KS-1) TaxID=743965 RepID=A0A7U3ZSE3_MYCPK|nr:cell division protein FtsZ [Mycoplasma putrefaciens]AEM68666.1 cell division protein FtsZ [Mycoplasma putrefaciens KS1]SYV95751.1 cell division protein FtsZ [Mycoplasma putrefaciens]